MKKSSTKITTLDKWFKRKTSDNFESSASVPVESNVDSSDPENHAKYPRIETNEIQTDNLEHDPGKCLQIWEYHVNQRDEVRRAYIKLGPYQPVLSNYPQKEKRNGSFQSSWFALFSSWLEYSPTTDATFCLSCFLFNKPSGHFGHRAFTVDGFKSWKKVKDGKSCAFLNHMGKDSNSTHKNVVRACEDLMKQPQHIQKVVENYSSQQILDNRLRVKTSIEVVRWLAFQGCEKVGFI